mmetsp:Transcript_8664/g.11724  ORF Transcript_8664/g.11724 Transcript_8664/m.11724 type:complete len:88 (-) Transcript_8664:37-300(-)
MFLNGKGVKVNLLQTLNLSLLHQTSKLGYRYPLLLIFPLGSTTSTSTTTVTTSTAITTTTTVSKTTSKTTSVASSFHVKYVKKKSAA